MKVLLKRVNLNGHIKGFHLTQIIKKVITNLVVSVVGGPVILTMKWAFFKSFFFFLKNILLRTLCLRFDSSGRIVLIKTEILIPTGIIWRISSDKWKAPLGS